MLCTAASLWAIYPEVSTVVPFWIVFVYIIRTSYITPRKKTNHNQKGTTLEPLGQSSCLEQPSQFRETGAVLPDVKGSQNELLRLAPQVELQATFRGPLIGMFVGVKM